MITRTIKRYELIRNLDTLQFAIKHKNEVYYLKATTWEEAEKEAKSYYDKLKEKNPNCIIVID